MVHRPSDSRLLTNLLSAEKDYSKQLQLLLDDYSHASLSSFAAYAAASPPPTSNAILAVAGALAGADEALRRYAGAVEGWREELRELKELEDDVGTIMRDREILVTRLIKASKAKQSNGSNRDSILSLAEPPEAAVSSLSLSSHLSAPHTLSHPLSLLSLNPSSKLSTAQAELQACEAHLATRERDLDEKRLRAIRTGLGGRCRALVECAWVWGEVGREGDRALEVLGPDPTAPAPQPQQIHAPLPLLPLSQHLQKPLPDPTTPTPTPPPRPSSNGSLTPSQSASNIALLALPQTVLVNGDAREEEEEHPTPTLANSAPSAYVPTPTTHAPQRRPLSLSLSRKITEESEEEHARGDGESSEDEVGLSVVVNPRFVAQGENKEAERGKEKGKRSFSIRSGRKLPPGTVSPAHSDAGEEKRGFFGSIRGLFGHREKEREAGGEKKWNRNLESRWKAGAELSSDEEGAGAGRRTRRSNVGPVLRNASPGGKLRKGKREGEEEGGGEKEKGKERKRKRSMGEVNVSRWRDSAVAGSPPPVPPLPSSSSPPLAGAGHKRTRSAGTGMGESELTKRRGRNTGTGVGGDQFYLDPILPPSNRTVKRTVSVSDTHLPIGGGGLGSGRAQEGGRGLVRTGSSRRASVDSYAGVAGGGEGRSAPRRSNSIQLPLALPSPHPNAVTTHTPSAPERTKIKRTAHERGAGGSGPEGPSLMSIVENVAQANREGWSHRPLPQDGVGGQYPQIGLGIPRVGTSTGTGMEVPKAPPRVLRGELDAVYPRVASSATTNATVVMTGMALPKAPGSVIRPAPYSNSTPNGTVTARNPATRPFQAGQLGPPKPLKSALRGSRTPSPNPGGPVPPPSLPPRENGKGDERVGQSVVVEAREKDADEASVSSYETGHENPDDEEEETDEDSPPAPPPHDEPPAPSDISASTASTLTAVPTRRKSVRVSLQPTFSPTPPALDDDETHMPWGGGEAWGKKRSVAAARGSEGEDEGEKHIWEDSSEEDEEYRRARRMLARVGKKKTKKKAKTKQ